MGLYVPSMPHLDGAVFPAWLEPQHPQRLGNYHPLLAIVRRWDTFEELESFQGSSSSGGLVRDHAAYRPIENLGRCSVVEGARFFGIYNVAFMEEIMVA